MPTRVGTLGNLRVDLEAVSDSVTRKAISDMQDFINRMVLTLGFEPEDQISGGAIGANHLSSNSIYQRHLTDGSIGTIEIITGSVTGDKIWQMSQDNLLLDGNFESGDSGPISWGAAKLGASWSVLDTFGGIDPDSGTFMGVWDATGSWWSGRFRGPWTDPAPSVSGWVPGAIACSDGESFSVRARIRGTAAHTAGFQLLAQTITAAGGAGVTQTSTIQNATTGWVTYEWNITVNHAGANCIMFGIQFGFGVSDVWLIDWIAARKAATAYDIIANAIEEGHIINGAVTTAKIGNYQVTTLKIGNGAVTEDQIGSGAVTEDGLANDAVTRNKILLGEVQSGHIDVLQINSGHVGALQINGGHIITDAIDSGHIGDDQVTGDHIGADEVDETHLAGDSVRWEHILAGEVKTDTLEDDVVTIVKVHQSAQSLLYTEEDTVDDELFDGSGTDDDTWVTFQQAAEEIEGLPSAGVTPVVISASGFCRVDQIRTGDIQQAPISSAPLLYVRVIRWESGSPPADKYADSAGDFTKVYEPNEAISISATGFYPCGVFTKIDTPGNGNWIWEIQVKWDDQIYGVGTVDYPGTGGADFLDSTGTQFISWLDPAWYSQGASASGSLSYDMFHTMYLSIVGDANSPWLIDDVLRQVGTDSLHIYTPGAAPATGSGLSYFIYDDDVAPEITKTYSHFQILEIVTER